MADYDCLLLGHNELDFQEYYNILENMASSGGRDHVAFTDLQLNHVEHQGRRFQGLDLLTEFYNEGRPQPQQQAFYNGDCLWTAIAYLGTYLHKRGYTFEYINLFQFEKEDLKKKLRENTYKVIALTGTMYVFEQNIWEVISFIRRQKRDAKIIAGGPYISKQAEEREPEYLKPLFKYLNADFYSYAREGETTLTQVIDAIKNGGDFGAIPELAYKQGREFIVTPKKQKVSLPATSTVKITPKGTDLQSRLQTTVVVSSDDKKVNPLVANMIDYQLFADAYRKSGWMNLRVSDGCPYACGFCSFPEHGNEHYVIMRIDRIEQEFDAIKACGAITHLFFIDATLNVPKSQFKAMLRMMIRKAYGFKWHCFFRCDQTDEETISLMQQAGCEGVFLGLESANETVLRNMDKSAHKDDFRRTVPWFKKYGIRQMVSVQVGFPGETCESFHESLDFLEEIQPDYTRIQIWFCDTTTPVWRRREEFKLEGKGYGWSHYSMDAETAVELVVNSFMSLRNVTWVPDPGYNWVAFYAMNKRGMSIERQKQYLELFGAAAKERLLKPNRKDMDAGLLRELKVCSQFDLQVEPDMSVAQKFSGQRYRQAEAYWVKAFTDAALDADADAVAVAPGAWASVSVEGDAALSGAALAALADAGAGTPAPLILAEFGAQLARHSGRAETCVIALPDHDEAFPVRVGDAHGGALAQRGAALGAAMEQAGQHRLFPFFILTNPQRLKQYSAQAKKMHAGFIYDDGDARGLPELLCGFPGLEQDLEFVLTVRRGEADGFAQLQLRYRASAVGAEAAASMLAALVSALRLAAHGLAVVRGGGCDGERGLALECE